MCLVFFGPVARDRRGLREDLLRLRERLECGEADALRAVARFATVR
jgi:hypothetical protein